ncbi:Proline oxidase [Niveomyces insectorum RCEF 264]|uniref:Proline dehydrogenase n=1 Tax=Niveomyces insectorum RCEF 264 TaxID=1081102 RepID=A0A167N8Z0_9HYPO|nr:Proline oxidase [Niveomyces insectorum RCEF 264]
MLITRSSPTRLLSSRGHFSLALSPTGQLIAASCSHFRLIHTSKNRPSPPYSASLVPHNGQNAYHQPQTDTGASTTDSTTTAPLSVLPLTSVLRSLMTTTVSSSPLLLKPSMAVMTALANSTSPLWNPDKNPLLRYILKNTFYAQFCAGETPQEVRATMAGLKRIGFDGVILGYAKEVVMEEEEEHGLSSYNDEGRQDVTKDEIKAWAEGTMQTLRLAEAGDFVALKFTGAGLQALHHLSQRLPPSPTLADAIDSICTLAVSRGVRLLFDAEQDAVQAGIDDWTLAYMRKYNSRERAVVYGTYQAYLKSTPKTVSKHLRAAREGGFALGVKLVRGAYLGSDPRHLIHDTKADTDAAYDGIAEAILRREWRSPLEHPTGGGGTFPNVQLVLASHNAESVRRARAVMAAAATTVDVAFGQLQGMADEISCQLVSEKKETQAAKAATTAAAAAGAAAPPIQVYKYLVWGSTGECMKYLLRRARENQDAVQRTKHSQRAMWNEVVRRVKQGVFRRA